MVSARSVYEKQNVTSPVEWKSRAFEREFAIFYEPLAPSQRKNVISLGDSAHERTALHTVVKQMPNCCNKSLKFMERPDLRQLREEHDLVSRCIPYIVDHDGNLDLCIRICQ